MVAYNFKARFVPLILAGAKNHTIRGHRKRHARPGELIQLQHGSRFKPVRFGQSPCLFAANIGIEFDRPSLAVFGESHPELDRLFNLSFDAFARADGFADFDDMARFWRDVHGTSRHSGVVVGWQPLPTLEAA